MEQVPSPKIMAMRTVFISRLSKYVGDHSAMEVQNELLASKPHMGYMQVIKIKHYYHIIKVIFEDSDKADTVIREGLYAFHIKKEASQCKKEQFTELITCLKCYKFEDHYSNECKMTQTICSENIRKHWKNYNQRNNSSGQTCH